MKSEETIEALRNSIRSLRKQIEENQKIIIYRKIADIIVTEIAQHNLQSEQIELREGFHLYWCDSDSDILAHVPTIFFLCDLESESIVYAGDTAQPETYLRRTKWKKYKFDTILGLSMPANYLTNSRLVDNIRLGRFQRTAFAPKENKRFAW